MKTSPPSACPFRDGTSAKAPLHPPGAWPPGPPSGATGWKLLRRMSRDLLGALTEWQTRHGDIFHLRIWPEHQIVVTDPQLARELLVGHGDALLRWERGIAVMSQLHGHSVLIAEGGEWRRKRHALHPSFTPRAVHRFVSTITDAAAQAFAGWKVDDGAWPIENSLTSLTMDVILRMMFSSELDGEARAAEAAVHQAAVAANAELYWPASWPDWMPWKHGKRRAINVLNALIDRHIRTRLALARGAWPDDLLTRLLELHEQDPGAWPLAAVHDECMTSFLAGHETVAATLTWWAWCMAANPEAQAAARREIQALLLGRAPVAEDIPALGYLTRTLQETLRLYPAAPVLLGRRSTRPIVLGGWQLPARTMFSVPVQLMHRDARWFPDPAAFRPERFDDDAPAIPRGAFMPFGAGPRVCLGQQLAMTEMTVIAAMLLQSFALSAPDGMDAPQPVFNISLRPGRSLSLRLAREPA